MTELTPVLEAATLEAAPPVLEAAPAATELDLNFAIGHDSLADDITGSIERIPAKVRVQLLKTAVKSYVHNRLSTAQAKVNKENAPWTLHEADPITVPAPEKPKSVLDAASIINEALKALYEDRLGRKTAGEPKPKKMANPLEAAITRAVVTALYQKRRATEPAVKYPTVQKEVGNDGRAYLENLIAQQVAAGGDEKELRKKMHDRYIRPAELLCGVNLPKTMADAGDLL